jgi:addiction module RelE/StbE family toxin
MRVVWTAPAARDLEAIGDYIARENPTAAQRIIGRILARTQTLASHPYLGRPGRVANTRELVVISTPFIVAYRVVGDRTEILAVFHSARRWPDSF